MVEEILEKLKRTCKRGIPFTKMQKHNTNVKKKKKKKRRIEKKRKYYLDTAQ